MRISAIFKVIGKRSFPYDFNGKSGVSYRLIVGQNDEAEIGEERVSEEVYKSAEKGKVYEFLGTKRTTFGKGDRTVFDKIKPLSGNDKATVE